MPVAALFFNASSTTLRKGTGPFCAELWLEVTERKQHKIIRLLNFMVHL
jgi:hypothetical protein